ncbi:MAG: TraR/DksA C4-type zinc finger protein [Candidatus Omnitrophica bacterium]|nr:TraR/DksA C4-type zinc finger protein [Candidatus Omnitrophota bacterium]
MPSKKSNGKKKTFTEKEIGDIRKDLVNEKQKIIEEIMSIKGETLKNFKDSSGDLSGYSFHMADMATDLYDREFLLELAEGERDILFALDEAIKRIDDGLYGNCSSCGEVIAKQRLKAMPQAENCIKCQEKAEKSVGK